MYFLLIILLIGGHEEAVTIDVYSDAQSCIDEGKTIKEALRFKCVPIKTPMLWRSI